MMGRAFARIMVVSVCLGLVAVLGPPLGPPQHVGRASQVATAVGIDADPAGNAATSLGEIDACVSVAAGQTFDVDIVVADVSDLAGWEALFTYDPSVLAVVEVNPELFLAAVEGSQVVDLSSEAEPGSYRFAVGDLSTTMGESGSGVVARVSLRATAAGASPLALEGVVLANSEAKAMGDIDGDSYFDGPVSGAQVWVDEPCPSPLPTLTSPPPATGPAPTATAPPATLATATSTAMAASPTGETPSPARTGSPVPPATGGEQGFSSTEEDGGFPWAVVGGVAGGVAAVVVLALVFGWRLRRAR